MSSTTLAYVGRFAPSPTGPLHFGSIVAALGSYLDAKHNHGLWLLRMDDLDLARVQAGAVDRILRALETLGLYWDGKVVYQSQRIEAYQRAEQLLQSRELLYPCYCSRKVLQGQTYAGTCRGAALKPKRQYALRIKTEATRYILHDLIQPEFSQNLFDEVGDFIIRRADGYYAYHLAVVVDDAEQRITHVVRGADLMDSTPRQIYLQELLGLDTPVYAHLPIALNQQAQKISKQAMAEDVLLINEPATILFNCLKFLGQEPDTQLSGSDVHELIDWGIENWSLDRVPRLATISAPATLLSPAQ